MFVIILGILAVLVLMAIGIYNKYVKLKNLNEEGWSGIEVYLQKRLDLIPNLVNTVKGYATHEKETLKNSAFLNPKNPPIILFGKVSTKVFLSLAVPL